MLIARWFLVVSLFVTGISAAQEPLLQKDVDAERVKLLLPLFRGPFDAAAKETDPWTPDARRVIELAVWRMQPRDLDWWSADRETHDLQAARVLALKVVDAGCKDPHALLASAWLLTEHYADAEIHPRGGEVLGQAMKALDTVDCHPLVQYLMKQRYRTVLRRSRVQYDDQQKGEQWIEEAIAAFQSGVFKDCTKDIASLLMTDWDDDHPEYVPPRAFLTAIETSDAVPQWFKHITRGRHALTMAWRERGNDWARNVPPASMAKFHELLDLAKQEFEAGNKLAPDQVQGIVGLLRVDMASGGTRITKLLEQGTAIQYDHPGLWFAYLTASMPRWGGSVEHLWRVAETLGGIDRHDTRVPWIGLMALQTIATDSNELARDPKYFELGKRLCNGYRAQMPPGMPPSRLDTIEAALATKSERWQDASAVLSRAGDTIERPLFTGISGYDERLARIKSAALVSTSADKIAAAIELESRGDAAAVAAAFDALSAQHDANTDTGAYVRFRAERARFVSAFNSGQAASALSPAAIDCWYPDRGRLRFDQAGRLVIANADTPLRAAFRPPFDGNFSLRGKVEAVAEKRASIPTINILPGVSFGDQSRHYSTSFSVHFPSRVSLWAGRFPKRDHTFNETFEFQIDVVNNHVSVTVDGKALIQEEPVAGANRFGTIGIDIPAADLPMPFEIRIVSLTLQKLDPIGQPIRPAP